MQITPVLSRRPQNPIYGAGQFSPSNQLTFGGQSGTERLHMLADRGKPEDVAKIAKVLLSNPQILDSIDELGNTALITAAHKGHDTIVGFLLSRGADATIKNQFGDTALMRAAKTGDFDSCQKLIDHLKQHKLPFRKVVNYAGSTALHHAAESKNYKLIQLFLDNGFDPGHKNHQKELPHYIAHRNNFFDGGDLMLKTIGRTPLPEWDEPDDPTYRKPQYEYYLPKAARKTSPNHSEIEASSSIADNDEEDWITPGQRALSLFMDGRSLLSLEPKQAKSIINDPDVLEELGMNLFTNASESDQQKEQIEKGLCFQFFNSCGAVQNFWRNLTRKTFERTPKEIAQDYPETSRLLEITQSEPKGKSKNPAVKPGFDGVAGMESLKQRLRRHVIAPLHNGPDPDVRVVKPNGLLFFGPSRTGKSHLAKALAHELGYDKVIKVSASDFISADQGVSMQKLRDIFQEAKEADGCVIIIDEFNQIAPRREGIQTHHAEMPQIVDQLALEMENIGEHDVLVIGTTNLPDAIDNAITEPGRLDKLIPIGLPDRAARAQLFKHIVEEQFITPHQISDEQFQALAKKTKGFSAGDIKQAVGDGINLWLDHKKQDSYHTYLEKAVAETKPGNDQATIQAFNEYIRQKGL